MIRLVPFSLPDDSPVLIHFLSQYTWAFYSKTHWSATDITNKITDGFYTAPDVRCFWIADEQDKHVGFIRLFDLGDSPDSSETPLFDIRIAETARGQGIGKTAIRLLIQYVFEHFPAKHRLEATTRWDNVAMRRVLEQTGFRQEAHYRKAWGSLSAGWTDAVGYAILRPDTQAESPAFWATEFVEQAVFRIEENPPRIARCLGELTEEEVWKRPNTQLSSIANLLLHLCGNIRQYAIAGLGGKTDRRQRDEEFAAQGGLSKQTLWDMLQQTVQEAVATIRIASPDNLLKMRSVQGFQLSGMGIILHVAEHFSYHTGQIAFYTKLLREQDLGFYAGINLNVVGDDK